MEQGPNPIYSNIVNIRMSDAELILDFGCVVPDPSAPGPVEFVPAIRVIMAIQGIQPLAEMLTKASAAYAEKVKTGFPTAEQSWDIEAMRKAASQG
jgi:hypothetical protein